MTDAWKYKVYFMFSGDHGCFQPMLPIITHAAFLPIITYVSMHKIDS